MRVLLTGATGFIGRHTARHLVAQRVDVRAAVRTPGTAPAGTTEVALPSLVDRVAVRAAVADIDVVVHLAARVHVLRETAPDPLAAFRAVNVEGTRVLAEESVRAGVRQFVFLSSLSVVGAESRSPWTEAEPCHPETHYGRSKLEAEQALAAVTREADLIVTSLRTPLTYGPGVGANMLRLLRLVDRGAPLPFGAVRNLRSYIAVENLVAAIDAAIATGTGAHGTYFVSDAHDLSTPDLVRMLARALGRPTRLVSVPPLLLRAAGRLGDVAGRVRPLPINTATLRQLCGNLQVVPDAFRRATGFVPPVSAEDALATTAAAYLAGASTSPGVSPH